MSEILKPEQLEYLNKFRNENDPLIKEMEDYAKENSVPILSYHASIFLRQLIAVKQPSRVLEIGTAIAYSSITIAKYLPEDSIIDTIEINPENVALAENYIIRSGLNKKINLIEGDALKVIPNLNYQYDLIYLDADKNVYRDAFEKSLPKLKEGGIVVVDNLLWHGWAAADEVPKKYKNSTKNIREFNEYFMALPGFLTSILSVGDGIGLGVKL